MKGYTLLECMLVLGILMIGAAAALPRMSDWYQLQNEKLLQQSLIESMHYAERQAQILQIPVIICPRAPDLRCGNDWLQGLLIFRDDFHDEVLHYQYQLLTRVKMPTQHGRLQWQGYPHYRSVIRFDLDWSQGMNGRFYYSRGNDHSPAWTLVLNKAGEVRLSSA